MKNHEIRKNKMKDTSYKSHLLADRSDYGFTLVELVVTIIVAVVLVPVVGVLLIGGHRAWCNTYDSAHKKIKQDAQAVMLALGNMGRKSNRLSYKIYNIEGSTFTEAEPEGTGQEVVSGDAVEFRYWDVGLDAEDSQELMDVTKTATAYALFYIDGDTLMIDRGPYPPGAVPVDGGGKNTNGVTTAVLAENVSVDPDMEAFSHTVINGVGQGAVRIYITLTDPEDGEKIKVMTATLMRNMWPR